MSTTTILVTGANSGLGLSTCERLIDEYLSTRPSTSTLTLIFTTRTATKSAQTQTHLTTHLHTTVSSIYGGTDSKTAPIRARQADRITLVPEHVDLCQLRSVRALAQRLEHARYRLDVLVCNAGMGDWTGIDWPRAIWATLVRPFESTVAPSYKITHVGRVVAEQLREQDRHAAGGVATTGTQVPSSTAPEPPLGEVFAANVFGHYLLAHWLAASGVLAPAVGREGDAARVVWVGSLEPTQRSWDARDPQTLTGGSSYDASKRLTELLVLSSESDSVRRYVKRFLPRAGNGEGAEGKAGGGKGAGRVRMYLSHPACSATNIAGINAVMTQLMLLLFYIVRLCGSPWHPIASYKGCVATVWLALAAQETLDGLEEGEGKGKWGAATDRLGNERVVRTRTDGWGWGGKEGETWDQIWRPTVRWWNECVLVTKQEREEFDDMAVKAWEEMERLRVEWEGILKDG